MDVVLLAPGSKTIFSLTWSQVCEFHWCFRIVTPTRTGWGGLLGTAVFLSICCALCIMYRTVPPIIHPDDNERGNCCRRFLGAILLPHKPISMFHTKMRLCQSRCTIENMRRQVDHCLCPYLCIEALNIENLSQASAIPINRWILVSISLRLVIKTLLLVWCKVPCEWLCCPGITATNRWGLLSKSISLATAFLQDIAPM